MYNERESSNRNVYPFRTLVKTSGRIRYTWEDKAGGYGIQDPFGMKAVKEIHGDYYNVVGLPVSRLCQMLKELGVEI